MLSEKWWPFCTSLNVLKWKRLIIYISFHIHFLHLLWHRNTIWHCQSGLKLVLVMAWHHLASSHNLNQSWLVLWSLRNKVLSNFNQNILIFIQYNVFENVFCKIVIISFMKRSKLQIHEISIIKCKIVKHNAIYQMRKIAHITCDHILT